MEWLVDHAGDPEVDEPLTPDQIRKFARQFGLSTFANSVVCSVIWRAHLLLCYIFSIPIVSSPEVHPEIDRCNARNECTFTFTGPTYAHFSLQRCYQHD